MRRPWGASRHVAGGLVVLSLVVACVACGGDGGGGDGGAPAPSVALFHGSQWFSGLLGDDGSPTMISAWGTGTADGMGDFTVAATQERNPPPDVAGFGVNYLVTVGPTRVMEWRLAGTGHILRGGLSASGEVGALATVSDGSRPEIGLSVRRSGAFSEASLSGKYHACSLEGASPTVASWGAITFDGSGTVTFAGGNANSEGTILTPIAFPSPYTVEPDGELRMYGGGLVGGVLAGGELAVLGGWPLSAAGLEILVRASTSASPATLSGSYFMVGLGYGPSYVSATGTLFANGSGSATMSLTANSGGTIATMPVAHPSYDVAADGTLTMGLLTGGVSPSGDFAVLAGATEAGSPPLLYFLLR